MCANEFLLLLLLPLLLLYSSASCDVSSTSSSLVWAFDGRWQHLCTVPHTKKEVAVVVVVPLHKQTNLVVSASSSACSPFRFSMPFHHHYDLEATLMSMSHTYYLRLKALKHTVDGSRSKIRKFSSSSGAMWSLKQLVRSSSLIVLKQRCWGVTHFQCHALI